ncbi:MAG: hypothetical protein ABW032_07430 [Burkholderiaceae bacterium]
MPSERPFELLGLAELPSSAIEELPFPDGAGLPADREARIAARRAFVGMKQLFLRAVENLEHRKAAWLRSQVRAAEDPIDLWLLRGPLLAILREDDLATRKLRAELYKSLDSTFPHMTAPPLRAAGPSHAMRG